VSKRAIGLVLNLVVSLVLGVLAAQKFFQLFDKTVPAGSMTDLVRAGTHSAYLVAGVVFGLIVFAWTALAVWLSRFFQPAGSGSPTAGLTPK
jgi:hypothetical protein